MRAIFIIYALFILSSCGFQTQNQLEVSTQGMSLEKSSMTGTTAGMVSVKSNMECVSTLSNDFDTFELHEDGVIVLKKDKPALGNYKVPVHIECIDTSQKDILVDINIVEISRVLTPWSNQVSGPDYMALGTEQCLDMVIDDLGYTYCVGYTDGSFAELSAGGDDALIIKFDPKGNVAWVSQLGSLSTAALSYDGSGNERCHSVDLDSMGNVYCAGSTTSSLSEPNAGGEDAFILKLDTNGNFLWASQLGTTKLTILAGNGSFNEICNGVVVDKNTNDVYCAGTTTSNLLESRGGSSDLFFMKFDSDGNHQWVRHIGTTSIGLWGGSAGMPDEGMDIGIDAAGDIYIVGNTRCAFAESNGGGNLRDGFILKFDSSNNFVWVHQIGSPSATGLGGSASQNDHFTSIMVDSTGNSHVVGYTESSLSDTVSGSTDLLAMKFDNTGAILWSTQIGVSTAIAESLDSSGDEQAFSVSLDSSGNSYYAGMTSGSLAEAGGGADDGFVMRLDINGNIDWVRQLGASSIANYSGDSSGNDSCRGIAVDDNGSVFCVGYTSGNLVGSNAGADDIFLLKTNAQGEFAP